MYRGIAGGSNRSDMMDEKTQIQHEKRDSVTLKRNAKGEYAWDVKLYFDSDDTGERLRVDVTLKELDKMLRAAYL